VRVPTRTQPSLPVRTTPEVPKAFTLRSQLPGVRLRGHAPPSPLREWALPVLIPHPNGSGIHVYPNSSPSRPLRPFFFPGRRQTLREPGKGESASSCLQSVIKPYKTQFLFPAFSPQSIRRTQNVYTFPTRIWPRCSPRRSFVVLFLERPR